VILAAGGSSRMGRPKQLLPLRGRPMVRLVTEAVCAAGLAQVVVVVGAGADRVCAALGGLPVEIRRNENWASGLSSSVRMGVEALRPEIGAVAMVLADQPALSPMLIEALVERHRATGAAVVVPSYHGRRGNPVLFDRALFPELLAVQGDQGGRSLVLRHEAELEEVPVLDPLEMADIDTREDYERARRDGGVRPTPGNEHTV